jgi:hypothetical protein
MAFYDIWSENPGENNQAPPYGAGESKMPFDQITDTMRVIMAACKQLAGSTVGSIRSMAYQDKEAVYIVGGAINGGVQIAAEALKSGIIALARIPTNLAGKYADGLTTAGMQYLYNLVHPVGQFTLWHSLDPYASLLIWPGVSATWVEVVGARDLMITTHGTKTGLISGAGYQIAGSKYGTEGEGGHYHNIPAVGAAAIQLAANQVPPITSADNILAVTPGAAANVVPRTAGLASTGVAPVGHGHTVPAHGTLNSGLDGNHGHNYTFDPGRFAFCIMQRTA